MDGIEQSLARPGFIEGTKRRTINQSNSCLGVRAAAADLEMKETNDFEYKGKERGGGGKAGGKGRLDETQRPLSIMNERNGSPTSAQSFSPSLFSLSLACSGGDVWVRCTGHGVVGDCCLGGGGAVRKR